MPASSNIIFEIEIDSSHRLTRGSFGSGIYPTISLIPACIAILAHSLQMGGKEKLG